MSDNLYKNSSSGSSSNAGTNARYSNAAHGYPNAGYSNAGYPNAAHGYSNAGSSNAAGYSNAAHGYSNASYPNAGYPNAGSSNAGGTNHPMPGLHAPVNEGEPDEEYFAWAENMNRWPRGWSNSPPDFPDGNIQDEVESDDGEPGNADGYPTPPRSPARARFVAGARRPARRPRSPAGARYPARRALSPGPARARFGARAPTPVCARVLARAPTPDRARYPARVPTPDRDRFAVHPRANYWATVLNPVPAAFAAPVPVPARAIAMAPAPAPAPAQFVAPAQYAATTPTLPSYELPIYEVVAARAARDGPGTPLPSLATIFRDLGFEPRAGSASVATAAHAPATGDATAQNTVNYEVAANNQSGYANQHDANQHDANQYDANQSSYVNQQGYNPYGNGSGSYGHGSNY